MPEIEGLARKGRQFVRVARRDGTSVLVGRALQIGSDRLLAGARPFNVQVRRADLEAVATVDTKAWQPATKPRVGQPWVVNVIMNPTDERSGGIMTTTRVMHMLEQRGHDCRIYVLYSGERRDIELHRQIARERFPQLRAEVHDVDDGMRDADVVLATAWTTAWCARATRSRGVRFYLVQDFEPAFYPAGSNASLAEETYRFGFVGITAGRWLAGKLARDYGMECSSFNLGVDLDCYRLDNPSDRNGVVFYARPDTDRRGYELGMLALDQFARRHPDVEVHLVGQKIHWRRPTFAFTNHGHLREPELAALYNRCAVGLVLSLTNLSLLPAELLAAGCLPVMNDAENTRASFNNPHACFSSARPDLLAASLSDAFTRSNEPGWRAQAAASVSHLSWDLVTDQVELGIRHGLVRADVGADSG